MRKLGLFGRPRCPSVCLSRSFVYCIHMADDIVKRLSRPGSPNILVFDPESWCPISRGTPSAGAHNTRGGRNLRNGAGPQTLPRLLGFLFIYAYTLCRRTTKFDVVTHVEEGRVSWGQPRLPPEESGVPAFPNVWGSPVFMPTPFNAERPNLAW